MKSTESRGGWKPGDSIMDSNITPEFPAEYILVGQDVVSALKNSICQYAVLGGITKNEFSLRPDYRMEVFLIKNFNGGYKDVQKSPYRFKLCGERKRN